MTESQLLKLKNRFYRGRVKKVMAALGLDPILRYFWRKVLLSKVNGIVTVGIGGVSADFSIGSYSEYNRISSLVGEKEVIEMLLEDLEDDDVVYDIGANVGIYSCFAVAACPNIEVIAFEPHSGNISKLSKNLFNNGESWRCFQIALGEKDEIVTFNLASDTPGESRHSVSTSEGKIKTMQVKASSLIKQEELPSPNIIKIDVEGAELSVLEGLDGFLHSARVVYCEVHGGGKDLEEIKEFFYSKGFETSVIQIDENTYHLRCTQ